MMMEPFYNRFLEIAEKETRGFIIPLGKKLPEGEYLLTESYCNDSKCDCRRVFINIFHNKNIVATIGYGWDDLPFYEKWLGEKELAVQMKGPILELGGQQTEHSLELLNLFKEVILKDSQYIERLKRHYDIFKNNLNNSGDGDEEDELEDFDPDDYRVIDLARETGTGFEAINDSNKEAFLPIIMAIEETIWRHYSEDSSLKDSDIIESLKNLRDNILSDDAKFNDLEKAIFNKLKLVLFLNNYDTRDLSLSISSVLKSAKLHKSIGGSRGYLDFISEFFEQMENAG